MRTYVVTGSASGIGAATADRLRTAGHAVIGVDLSGAEIDADLSHAHGRTAMARAVEERCGGSIDAVVACAGIALDSPRTIAVNFFGAVATLELLRPMLAAGEEPRAVAVSSVASILGADDRVVEACLAGDETEACRLTEEAAAMAYLTSKAALSRWIRRQAIAADWAGAGIPLNAVAPGTVVTPMTAEILASDGGLELVDSAVPMPLHGHATPDAVAAVLEFLTSPGNTHVTGQVVFIDGGADAVLRGDSTW